MFPLPLQFIVAMVAYAINERMAHRVDYPLKEVRVLREVYTEDTGRKRIPFTRSQVREAIRLPTREDIIRYALDLDAVVERDPIAARESHRRLFDGGRLALEPQTEGFYVARGNLLPLVASTDAMLPLAAKPREGILEASGRVLNSSLSSGG